MLYAWKHSLRPWSRPARSDPARLPFHGLRQRQHLYKQILQFHRKGLAEIRQGVVIRVLFPCNKAERDRIIGRPLNLPTGENPGG